MPAGCVTTRATTTPTPLSSIADHIAALQRTNVGIEANIHTMECLYEKSVIVIRAGDKEQTHKMISQYGPVLIEAVNDTIDRHRENDSTCSQDLQVFFFLSVSTIMVFITSGFDRERCISSYQFPEPVEAILLKKDGLFDISVAVLAEAAENKRTSATKQLLHFTILLLMPDLLSQNGTAKVTSRCLPVLVVVSNDSILFENADLFTNACTILSYCFQRYIFLDLFDQIIFFLSLGIAHHMDDDKATHTACEVLRTILPEQKVKAIIDSAVEYYFEDCIYSPAA